MPDGGCNEKDNFTCQLRQYGTCYQGDLVTVQREQNKRQTVNFFQMFSPFSIFIIKNKTFSRQLDIILFGSDILFYNNTYLRFVKI